MEIYEEAGLYEKLASIQYSAAMIKYCKRFNQNSSLWILERHSHPYLELMFFLRGKATIAAGSEVLALSSYDLVFYLPFHEHLEAIDLSQSQEVICIWIDTGELSLDRGGAIRLRDTDRTLEWLFMHIEKEFADNGEFSESIVASYLNAIIKIILRQMKLLDYSNALNPAKRAQDYIKANFTQDISMARLAKYCNVSPSYLYRLFQRQYLISPLQYLTNRRMLEAKYLLEFSTLSIMNIAEHCGFNDPRYFSRLFKKYTGCTPSQYKENPQKKQTEIFIDE